MSEQYPSFNAAQRRSPAFSDISFENLQPASTRHERCLHELFEAQVLATPHATAAFLDSELLSYGQLNARANQLAYYLRKRGVGRDVLVGVCMERSPDALVALIAILKAGGAYVPLDPAYPKDRIAFILSDANCRLLITKREWLGCVPADAAELVLLDANSSLIANCPDQNLEPASGPKDLAYVIYTSGSTGKPKGVQIEHYSVANLLRSMEQETGISATDVFAAVTTLCFDIAGLEMYLPLIAGASIAIVPHEETVDGSKLQARLQKAGINFLQGTPAVFRLLLDAGWKGDNKLNVIVGGEAFPREIANALVSRCKSVWNAYGPTETTIWSSVYRVASRGEGSVPIGRAVRETYFRIVDEQLNPVEAGQEGELLIGGAGVARGYLNRPELNRDKFISDPLSADRGARLYRTGDLVRLLPDGNLAYVGRMDHQVKVRGYRIELGEIESVLATHPSVKQCVVLAREDSPGDRRLVAYIIAAAGQTPVARVLREFLATKLPDYMVPTAFVLVPAMPLTPNGKVDRKALPVPTRENSILDHEYVAPRSDLEKRLVRIWERALGIVPIGIRDNVFDLGVDSIIAARLFAEIEKTLGRDLPPGPLFRAPTVQSLAELLEREQAVPRRWTSLIPIQPHGTKKPLFCVHGAAGTVLFFQALANRLAPARPLYAFQAQGLHGRDVPHTSIEQMAAHYIQEMRTIQPQGPYLLGGWCFGGLVVFEMAQQLRRVGESVEMLAMFNAPSGPAYEFRPSAPELNPMGVRLNARWREFRDLSFGQKVQYARQKAIGQVTWRSRSLYNRVQTLVHRKLLIKVRHAINGYYGKRGRPLPEYIRDKYFLYANSRLERFYQHRAYLGSIVVFRDQLSYRDSALGWGRFARDVEVHDIPVSAKDHRALLQEPAVGLLAAKIEEYLSRRAKFHASVGDAA
jgi:amino acid adenylation domain-containing protein